MLLLRPETLQALKLIPQSLNLLKEEAILLALAEESSAKAAAGALDNGWVWGLGVQGLGFRRFRTGVRALRVAGGGVSRVCGFTQRPQSSSFLGLPYRILYMNPKKELLWGLWVRHNYTGWLIEGFKLAGSLYPRHPKGFRTPCNCQC